MKTSKVIAMVMVGLALSFTPALAQRHGGGGSRGGGASMSRSSSPSRSSSSFSSPSRSSSISSPSRSSSSSRSGSFSSSSRNTVSTPSRSSSFSSPSRSTSSSRNSSFGTPSRATSSTPSRSSSSFSSSSRNSSFGTPSRNSSAVPARSGSFSTPARSAAGAPGGGPTSTVIRGGGEIPSGYVRPSSNPGARSGGYARPGHPGSLPPSHRPIHPAPYFYHPWHGHVVHCHPIFWDPLPLRPLFWPGFWLYCNSYWYDYHVTDVVVVRDYVKETYSVDMVTFGISGDIMYAIVKDGGETYLQVYDKEDHLLAEQKIHRKYCNMVIDPENGGCWISKKHDKDPLLFIWVPEEAKLLIYEAD